MMTNINYSNYDSDNESSIYSDEERLESDYPEEETSDEEEYEELRNHYYVNIPEKLLSFTNNQLNYVVNTYGDYETEYGHLYASYYLKHAKPLQYFLFNTMLITQSINDRPYSQISVKYDIDEDFMNALIKKTDICEKFGHFQITKNNNEFVRIDNHCCHMEIEDGMPYYFDGIHKSENCIDVYIRYSKTFPKLLSNGGIEYTGDHIFFKVMMKMLEQMSLKFFMRNNYKDEYLKHINISRKNYFNHIHYKNYCKVILKKIYPLFIVMRKCLNNKKNTISKLNNDILDHIMIKVLKKVDVNFNLKNIQQIQYCK